jgi:ribonuclease Z
LDDRNRTSPYSLTILGSAASIPDSNHDTTGFLLRGPGCAVFVECGGSPLFKAAQLGVDLEEVRAVILSHQHADHIYGLPMLVQGLWLSRRQEPLPIYGPAKTLEIARALLALFDLDQREDMYRIEWKSIPLRERRIVLEAEEVRITASPVMHRYSDTVALRFDNTTTGRSIVYSGDTEPCEPLVNLARGAGLLIHEATGGYDGHSSPADAARVASDAGVGELALIHYPVHGVDLEAWRLSAEEFQGPVWSAEDGDVYPL